MPAPPIPVPFAAVRATLALRRRVLGLADRLLPADGALWDLAAGMQRTQLAGALVTSGIADALGEGPRAPTEVADELGLDREVTGRVLEAAAAARLVRIDRRGRARLTRTGGPLRADHPSSIASWAAHQARPLHGPAYASLAAQLREGAQPGGFRRAAGESYWDHLARHPEEGAEFDSAMRQLTGIDLAALTRAYPWPKSGVICDVGGGRGQLLAAILDRRPGARGILIESPEVLAGAEELLRSRGLADRVECRPGDLMGDLDAGADLYVLKWILHSWSDEACVGLLSRLRATMPEGARVLVIDQHLERNRPNAVTPLADLHMLVISEGGRERSPDDVRWLLGEAGLRPGRVRHSGLQMLVEGLAPGEAV